MKLIWKIILWPLGIILCLLSIVGFSEGDIAEALLALFLGLISIPPILTFFAKERKGKSQNSTTQLQIATSEEVQKPETKI